jgi:hypothetical protein
VYRNIRASWKGERWRRRWAWWSSGREYGKDWTRKRSWGWSRSQNGDVKGWGGGERLVMRMRRKEGECEEPPLRTRFCRECHGLRTHSSSSPAAEIAHAATGARPALPAHALREGK